MAHAERKAQWSIMDTMRDMCGVPFPAHAPTPVLLALPATSTAGPAHVTSAVTVAGLPPPEKIPALHSTTGPAQEDTAQEKPVLAGHGLKQHGNALAQEDNAEETLHSTTGPAQEDTAQEKPVPAQEDNAEEKAVIAAALDNGAALGISTGPAQESVAANGNTTHEGTATGTVTEDERVLSPVAAPGGDDAGTWPCGFDDGNASAELPPLRPILPGS